MAVKPVKYLPDWFPGTQFKQDARAFKELALAARWLPFNMVKRQVGFESCPRCGAEVLTQRTPSGFLRHGPTFVHIILAGSIS